MKKNILLSLLLASLLNANTDSKVNMQNYLENHNSVDGTKKEFVSEFKDSTKFDVAKGFYNYKEVVYSRIVDYRGDSETSIATATTNKTFDVLAAEKTRLEELNKIKDKEKEASAKEEEKDIYAQGYCRFRNSVEVTKMSEYSYLDCQFNDIGNATLAVLIVPDFYAQALVAQPLYVSVSDEFGNSKRLNTTNGAILNATKSSINIANVVNDYMLEKIIASTSYQAGTIATQQAKAYLEAKTDARTSEQITYVDTGDGTTEAVKTKNTQMPEKSDYISGAAVELVSAVVKTIGKSVLSNINYSFKVNKDAIVYADLVISGKSNANNNGGLLKTPKLINKESSNPIEEDGTYKFIPDDSKLEIDIDSATINKNSGQGK